MAITGPVSEFIAERLGSDETFTAYRAGKLSRPEFIGWCEANAGPLSETIGGSYHVNILARWPADFRRNALEAYETLRQAGIVTSAANPAAFAAYAERVRSHFRHEDFATYIQPDEAELLYHVAMDAKPRRLAVFGAYYGYWAVWALAGVEAAGGRAYLFDPNPAVCALAERNMEALGFGDRVEVVNAPAEEGLDRIGGPIGMALLDAAGSHDHPDASYHGKGVYAHIIRAAAGLLAPDALLLTHNDHVAEPGAHPYLQGFYKGAAEGLAPFHAFCEQRFEQQLRLPTPEGFGVYATLKA